MKPPIPYVYRVRRAPRARRNRWELVVVPPYGAPLLLSAYRTLRRALGTARTLAIGGGMVEVTG
jgi:hypothetical protein